LRLEPAALGPSREPVPPSPPLRSAPLPCPTFPSPSPPPPRLDPPTENAVRTLDETRRRRRRRGERDGCFDVRLERKKIISRLFISVTAKLQLNRRRDGPFRKGKEKERNERTRKTEEDRDASRKDSTSVPHFCSFVRASRKSRNRIRSRSRTGLSRFVHPKRYILFASCILAFHPTPPISDWRMLEIRKSNKISPTKRSVKVFSLATFGKPRTFRQSRKLSRGNLATPLSRYAVRTLSCPFVRQLRK